MQRNTQFVLLAGLLFTGVLLGRAFLQQDLQQEKSSPDSSPPTANPIVSVNPVDSAPAVVIEEVARIDGPLKLWTTSTKSIDADIDIPGAQSNVEGAVRIQFDTSNLRSLRRGDELRIEVPQKATDYRVSIKKVVQHPDGIMVIEARQNDDVRLILTLGQKNTFANLATLDGNFELVGNTKTGWLMPTANMDPDLDPSIPDFVVLPNSPAERQAQLQAKRQILN